MFSADFEPAQAIANAWQIVKKSAEESNASDLLENLTLLLEPGRSVISDAGICLTTIRNLKNRPISDSKSKIQDLSFENRKSRDYWILTDAGFNILLSMETYKWYYHLVSAAHAAEAHDFPYKIAGPLCDGGDVYFDIEGEDRLPEYRLLPRGMQPNEILALLNCGAYSIAQMFQYNGRFLPSIVLIRENGEVELIRKRDNFEDLINKDVW